MSRLIMSRRHESSDCLCGPTGFDSSVWTRLRTIWRALFASLTTRCGNSITKCEESLVRTTIVASTLSPVITRDRHGRLDAVVGPTTQVALTRGRPAGLTSCLPRLMQLSSFAPPQIPTVPLPLFWAGPWARGPHIHGVRRRTPGLNVRKPLARSPAPTSHHVSGLLLRRSFHNTSSGTFPEDVEAVESELSARKPLVVDHEHLLAHVAAEGGRPGPLHSGEGAEEQVDRIPPYALNFTSMLRVL